MSGQSANRLPTVCLPTPRQPTNRQPPANRLQTNRLLTACKPPANLSESKRSEVTIITKPLEGIVFAEVRKAAGSAAVRPGAPGLVGVLRVCQQCCPEHGWGWRGRWTCRIGLRHPGRAGAGHHLVPGQWGGQKTHSSAGAGVQDLWCRHAWDIAVALLPGRQISITSATRLPFV